jgi:hypothetical protein
VLTLRVLTSDFPHRRLRTVGSDVNATGEDAAEVRFLSAKDCAESRFAAGQSVAIELEIAHRQEEGNDATEERRTREADPGDVSD